MQERTSIIYFRLLLLSIVFPTMALAQDIKKDVQVFANKHFYHEALTNLLYDNDLDFEKHFGCESVMFKQKRASGGIQATCFNSKNIILHIVADIDRSAERPHRVYVCPDHASGRLPFMNDITTITSRAYEKDELDNAHLYFMGYGKSWLRKYVNIIAEQKNTKLVCWELRRR